MSRYPLDGTVFSVGSTAEQEPLDILDVTDSSWQEGTSCHYLRTSRFQESRVSMGLSRNLDWREVMSWYAIGGAANVVTGTTHREPGSIDACWWSSPLRASTIARDSVQPESWILSDDWPGWQWDPGGLLVGRYHERSGRDPGIERSLHIRVMQRSEEINEGGNLVG